MNHEMMKENFWLRRYTFLDSGKNGLDEMKRKEKENE